MLKNNYVDPNFMLHTFWVYIHTNGCTLFFFVFVFLQSFDDLVAKGIPKQNMKIKDKDGSDMGKSVGPDYVVCIECKYDFSSSPQIKWY